MPELVNPYTAGDPVGKTSAFVGREDVLREVTRVLRHPTQNALTLYGQRRIGKTSILQYLEIHLPKQGPYRPVHFDLMGKAGAPLSNILRDLARTIALKLNLPDPDLGAAPEQAFRETYLPRVLHALPEKTSLVLLLDEFDVLADPQQEQQAKRQFFGYIRDLRQINPARLQFIFVLGRNLDDLDIVAQGLFKDLPSTRVSLLERKDAETLVGLSERAGDLAWTDAAVARIWNLTAGHPYLTQALCSQIWDDAHDAADEPSPVEPEAVDAAIPGALERSENMFTWLWEGLGPAEKVVAAALAGAGPVVVDADHLSTILAESGVRILIGELRDAPHVLQKWDILTPADGGYCFRVELLRRWIEENKPLSRTQEELDYVNTVANSFFDAANGLYRNNNLEQAESTLRQALGLNPNHIRAHELLAEILLAKDALDEAQTTLEKLGSLAPGRARPRLKQIYLQRAEAITEDTEKLKWYEKVLVLYPEDPQAGEGRHQTYCSIGERALQNRDFAGALDAFQRTRLTENETQQRLKQAYLVLAENATEETECLEWYGKILDLLPGDLQATQAKREIYRRQGESALAAENFDAARAAFDKADDAKKMAEVDRIRQQRDQEAHLAEIDKMEEKKDYEQAYLRAKTCAEKYPKARSWDDELKRLEAKAGLRGKYQQALEASERGEREQAIRLLGEVIGLDPEYEEASRHLYRMVTGHDPVTLQEETEKVRELLKNLQPDHLSHWHPLYYLRLLGWGLIQSDKFKIYWDTFGKAAGYPVGNRLAFGAAVLVAIVEAVGALIGVAIILAVLVVVGGLAIAGVSYMASIAEKDTEDSKLSS